MYWITLIGDVTSLIMLMQQGEVRDGADIEPAKLFIPGQLWFLSVFSTIFSSMFVLSLNKTVKV